MPGMKVTGVTHWSIPVNNLDESERFYGELLGLKHLGRLGNARMSCFNVGDHNILLCERPNKETPEDDGARVHHSFNVDPDKWEEAVAEVHRWGAELAPDEPLVYREKGYFTGRELYLMDPSGNRIEIRDGTWKAGMPKPSIEEIVAKAPAA